MFIAIKDVAKNFIQTVSFRILRLERNIAWLTEQHSSMLAQAGSINMFHLTFCLKLSNFQLHNEIESLKCRNRGNKKRLVQNLNTDHPPELQFQLLMGAPAGTTSNLISSPPSTSDPSTNITTLNPSNLGTPEDVADNHGNNLTLISTLGGVAPLQVKQQSGSSLCSIFFSSHVNT